MGRLHAGTGALRLFVLLTLVFIASCNTPTGPSNDVPNSPSVYDGRPVDVQGTVYVSSQDLELSVWDDDFVDNDVVTLVVNDQVVLEDYSLQGPEAKRVVQGHLEYRGYNYLLLGFPWEGDEGLASVALSISDGQSVQELSIYGHRYKAFAYHVVVQ